MKNILTVTKTLAALAVAFAVTTAAHATPITGSISFTGTPQFINGDTAVQFNGSYVNAVPTGSFAPIGEFAGFNAPPINSTDLVSFQTIIFDPLTLPTGHLWQVVIPGGDTFSLQATTINFTSPPSQPIWDFAGKGIFSISGPNGSFTNTAGSWSISFSQNGQLNFEATSGVNAPDGGTTALLVGAGLLGLAFVARRFAKA